MANLSPAILHDYQFINPVPPPLTKSMLSVKMGTDGFTRETVNPFHTHAIFVLGVEMEILVLQCQTMKEDVILFLQLGSARK